MRQWVEFQRQEFLGFGTVFILFTSTDIPHYVQSSNAESYAAGLACEVRAVPWDSKHP